MNKLLKFKDCIIIFVVGILFIVGGIFVLNSKDTATETTEATIYNIETTNYDEETNQYSYNVYLTYKDASGIEHKATINAYDSSWQNGTVITIKYDPQHPENISYGNLSNSVMSYIFLGIGAISIVVGSVKLVKDLKNTDK